MSRSLLHVTVITALVIVFAQQQSFAQRGKPSPAEIRKLDAKADQAEQDFLKTLVELSKDYEDVGDIERSKEVLRRILKLKPDVDSVKQKLKDYEEAVFEDRMTIIDLDVSRNWANAGVKVTKDLPVRIEADGTYKFMVNEELGPKGYDREDAVNEIVAGVPTGALMGMIAPIPGAGNRKKQEPQPFLVGEGKEFKPQESGILFLKVNTPSQAKCIGKLKIRLSGNISR